MKTTMWTCLYLFVFTPIACVISGYFLTFGYELYYELNVEYEIEQPVDYSPTNHEVSAEVHYDYHHNSIPYSISLLHPHDEDGYS